MMQKLNVKIMLAVFFAIAAVFVYFFYFSNAPFERKITWGIDFSQMQAQSLNLDWKKVYMALLEDLGAKHIKLHTQWNFLETKKDEFNFNDTDWQLEQAQNHGASIIYVTGMKTGRWPECHIPDFAKDLSKQEQQNNILSYIKETVTRYKSSPAIIAWQAENEPLFNFGQCPWYDKDFLKQEVALIKSIDPTRPVIISDSGEQSLWTGAAQIGDVVGVTTYRRVWVTLSDDRGFYVTSPFSPGSYWIKSQIIEKLFGKKVIGVELQAEPWTHKSLAQSSLEEQAKTMDAIQLQENIAYAKKTGLDTFYFWGVEWWYWMKTTQNQPEIWNLAKTVFQ